MQTVFDWLTLAAFAGLVVLFLQRSTQDELQDSIWQYAPPAIGCALSNWLGNNGHAAASIAVLAASIAYVFIVLKPFPTKR
ncbi:XrtV sorting system accessory protein [Sphingomonas qilianensis]|uniref:XrtV sorting system accessory protein n=1 Tax=Sphingomonas qilianensis TaxID=1736690 RepID=A0ABU9XP19_9SPHN